MIKETVTVLCMAGILLFTVVLVSLWRNAKAAADKKLKLMNITISLACILAACVSWGTNPGWMRVIYGPLMLEHVILFLIMKFSKPMRIVNYLVYATFTAVAGRV